jgi:rod shape-determining protein MreB
MFGFGQDIGIDLGTATVLIYVKGKGIVLKEPSVAAVDKLTGKLFAVGYEAQRMIGRTPGNIVAVRPLRDGVISDYDVTEKMLKSFLSKINISRIFKPNIMICVPSGVTDVEERAVKDATIQAGAKKAFIIEEPIAAAIGSGIDISQPNGTMIVDIGGGTSDIAVISLGGVVVSTSIKVAGDKFDEAIIKFIRKKHNVLIGERTAEQIKHNVGCVFLLEEEKITEVKGRNLLTGLPKIFPVTSTEIYEALTDTANIIVDAVHQTLEKTPPELVGDIASTGIIMTGGGSLLEGFTNLVTQRTGIKSFVSDDPTTCVALGTGKALSQMHLLSDNSNSVASRKYYD